MKILAFQALAANLILFIFSHFAFAVNINTASAEELARELYGIGPIKAQRIVEYREKMGNFTSPEQLTEVKGIGPKTLERNRDKISIFDVSSKSLKPPLSTKPFLSTKPPLSTKELMPNNHTKKDSLLDDFSIVQNGFKEDLSPKVDSRFKFFYRKKLEPRKESLIPVYNQFWDTLFIILLFLIVLLVFIIAWFKGAKKDKPVLRKHLVSTTFVCSGCGKVTHFQNVRYEGHFNIQYVDGDLPPGWLCIPNWLGKPCDYCFECSSAK